MLIVNNTLPKSGGVWLHSMICRLIEYRFPASRWTQPGWNSPSPAESELPIFLKEECWRDENVLFKAHYSVRAIKALQKPGIRVIMGVRDPADAALSRYYHLQREGLSQARDAWLLEHGVFFVKGLRVLEDKWRGAALMTRYEAMCDRPHDELARVARYLGVKPIWQTLDFIIRDTAADKRRGESGGHIRRASPGAAREELPADVYRELSNV